MIDWQAYFWKGWIVGPDETEASFMERARSTRAACPLQWQGITMESMEIEYSNQGLWPWEGACCWVDPSSVRVQLRTAFKRRSQWLGYSREELLIHEAIHALRARFTEPRFEEHLAYQTSSSPFRKRWGPIFRSSKESGFFILICLVSGLWWQWTWPLFWGVILYLSIRLRTEQRILKKTKKKLQQLSDLSDLLLIALTDREILHFSTQSLTEIRHYVATESSPRWQQLRAVFFPS